MFIVSLVDRMTVVQYAIETHWHTQISRGSVFLFFLFSLIIYSKSQRAARSFFGNCSTTFPKHVARLVRILAPTDPTHSYAPRRKKTIPAAICNKKGIHRRALYL